MMRVLLLAILILFSFNFFAQDTEVWMHPNRGQWHENIRYKLDLQIGEFLVEENGFKYIFHNVGELTHQHDDHKNEPVDHFTQHVIKATFLGSNSDFLVQEGQQSTFYRNYILGNDPSKWRSDVHSVREVGYKAFYDGIDMEMAVVGTSFKYSFRVAPHVSPDIIQYKLEGAKAVKLDKSGNLLIQHIYGEVMESAPVAWTVDTQGKKTMVKAKFHLEDDLVGFSFPDGFDANQTLIIDPQITFSTYTGSTADNWGCTATPDSFGNLFAGGTVFGIGYPLTPGVLDVSFNGGENIGYDGFDIGLTKFNEDGTAFMFSTYVGGSGNEAPSSMIANGLNELYILGATSSSNFPMGGTPFDASFNGGSTLNFESSQGMSGSDIFIVKLNVAGTAVLNATYVGGTGNDGVNPGQSGSFDGDLVYNYGDNFRGEIMLDENNNVYVASSTRSSNFPIMSPAQVFLSGQQDAVLFKMNPGLSVMMWGTYYGGTGLETGNAVAINSLGEVYLTGGTSSANLQVPGGHSTMFTGGETDGYVTRFNGTTGALMSGTYIGTGGYDQSFFVQVDPSDFVYVYGQTDGAMTISAGVFGNANAQQFIRKYAQNLSSVVWNTKVGGSGGRISPTAFLVSNCYEIYFSGWGGQILGTSVANFPITPGAFQNSSPDGDAFYICVLDPDATGMQYATFMGGPSHDHVDGGTSRFDKNGRVYHAVCASCGGNGNGFVSTPGVVSPTNQSSNCNLAAFKFELNSINAIVNEPNFIICIPQPVQFFNNSTEGDVFFWDFGDGTFSNEANPSHVYTEVGDFTVKLVVSDSQGCKAPDSTSFVVNVGSFEAGSVTPPPTVCKGAPYQFDAFGGLNYTWSPANVLDNPNIPNPIATVYSTTNFSVIISDTCGSDTIFVTLPVFDDAISVSPDTSICLGHNVQIEVFGAVSQVWTPNSFISNNTDNNPVVDPQSPTYYVVSATTVNSCVFEDSVFVDVFFNPPQPNMIDTSVLCFGASLDITVSGASTYLWSPNTRINTIVGPNVTVNPLGDITYFCDFTNACGTVRDSVFIDVVRPNIQVFNDTTICLGDTAMLRATGTPFYQWSPGTGLNSITNDTVFATPHLPTVYTVIGVDSFLCRDTAIVSVGIFPVHQVNAGSTIFASLGELVQLEATANAPGEFLWSPGNFLTCTTCYNPIANPNYNYSYTVYFTDTNGCVTDDIVAINYEGIIYVPNTFTPDGSHFNEVFKAYGEGIISFEMLIFNRWGELICTLNSMDDYWDGTYKGKMCQDGTYTWKITYCDITREFKTITGHINLLR